MKVASRMEMQGLDRRASREFLVPEEILMENAGQSAVAVLATQWGEIRSGHFVVICGTGNNGGDGLVVARHLHSRGGKVSLFIVSDPGKFNGPAKLNWEIVSRLSLPVRVLENPEELLQEIDRAQVIVDALFGTGLDRAVAGPGKQVIEIINRSGKKVLSLDIPSGVNGDTGEVMGIAVRADWTVTFGLPKRGNILHPGYELAGSLFWAPISFPPALQEQEDIKVALNAYLALPPRSRSAHKGSQGDCLVVAGSRNYWGAPALCGLSFLKAGGGYVRVAAPESMLSGIASRAGELVLIPQKETPAGSLARSNQNDLIRLAEKADCVIIGPGLSLDPETSMLVQALLEDINKPMIIDGDALSVLAKNRTCLRAKKIPPLLTPHLGEMSRLTGRPRQEWEGGKIPVLQNFCTREGVVVVLKGPHSLIGLPDGQVFVNLTGNPGMATAGAGDCLPGVIAAMYGQGLGWEEAVRKGVYLHGLAGDLAAEAKGEDGMTAGDIMESLPEALKLDRQGLPAPLRRRYEILPAL